MYFLWLERARSSRRCGEGITHSVYLCEYNTCISFSFYNQFDNHVENTFVQALQKSNVKFKTRRMMGQHHVSVYCPDYCDLIYSTKICELKSQNRNEAEQETIRILDTITSSPS